MSVDLKSECREAIAVSIGDEQYEKQIEANAISQVQKVALTDVQNNNKSAKGDKPGFFEEIEPWHEAVNAVELFDEIRRIVNSHLILREHTDVAITLWVANTYLFDLFDVCPILAITSPAYSSGKSTTLDVIDKLSCNTLRASNITSGALFRVIEQCSPTLLIDEADSFLKSQDELIGLIKAGFKRSDSFLLKCSGDNHEPTRYSTWSPKAIAGNGSFDDVLSSRCIPIKMIRKSTEQKIKRMSHDTSYEEIKRKLLRWSLDVEGNIQKVVPMDLRGNLPDRAADFWEPLLANAKLISSEWEQLAVESAIGLNGIGVTKQQDFSMELLKDIHAIFEERKLSIHNPETASHISAQDLSNKLSEILESPWGTMKGGHGITPHAVAKMLGEFDIKSFKGRVEGYSAGSKLYARKDFESTFVRYLQVTPSA